VASPLQCTATVPRALVTLASFALVTAILYAAKPVFVPVALAVLLAFLLTPVVRVLERHVPHAAAVALVIAFAFSALGVVGWVVSRQVTTLADELPRYRHNIRQRIADIRGASRGSAIEKLQSTAEDVMEELGREGPGTAPPADKPVVVEGRGVLVAITALGPIVEAMVSAALVLALTVFMVARRQDLRARLFRLIGESRLPVATKAMDEATGRVMQYVSAFAVINASFGVAVGVGLWLIGVPYAILWGAAAGALRFVPYVGVWIGALLPIMLSLAVFPGWTKPLLVVALFALLEPLIFMVLEPLIYGHTAGVSAIALLVAVAFWAWLWGPIGLILAVPLTVCLVVLGNHIPGLRFLAILMGDDVSMPPAMNYYQRVLAGDADEAADIVEDFRLAHPGDRGWDEVLLPALSYARRDRASGRIDASDQASVVRTTRDIASEVAGEPPTFGPEADRVRIIGCAVRDEIDEAAFILLRHLLDPHRWDLELASAELLSSEVVGLVAEKGGGLICVGGVAPGGVAHTRYLVKRLRARFPDARIVVAHWAAPGLGETDLGALRTAGANAVVTSLAEARDALAALASAVPRSAAPASAA
jgi:predicted PurR-regulated permease PerM